MFSNNRNEMRKVFFEAWRKHQNNLPQAEVEAELVAVILLHPEYHEMLADPEDFQDQEFGAENPFLHLSLHLAIRDQVGTDRPFGIKKVYENLLVKRQDVLAVEHAMMSCLEKILWQAQESGHMPDEGVYLEMLREL
jgi:hypothetical protein